MLLSLIIVFAAIGLIFIAIGFFLEDTNPYLILFGSMFLLLIAVGTMAQGIEIKTGDILLNATPEGNKTITSITQETEIISNIRIDSFAIIVVLISLYLAYFSIAEIISRRYGQADID
ncbi:hypothetical protein LCGC14_0912480 [marine sediment metagenome]|uniref:Uncharacterized protein n=1 Tax=marine sediment metagenome TaxID=412755 RepID=A0A0F9NXS8_9ZZZZ